MNMANSSLHISLSDALKKDALTQVKKRNFSHPTDYVRHLIRQDVLRAKAKAEFTEFIKQGIASPSCGQSPQEMIEELKKNVTQEA